MPMLLPTFTEKLIAYDKEYSSEILPKKFYLGSIKVPHY
jgi:hypothetical protein